MMENLKTQNSRHHLNTVYIDFKIVLDLLRSGYKFDDADAPQVLEQLEKCVTLLKTEIESMDR